MPDEILTGEEQSLERLREMLGEQGCSVRFYRWDVKANRKTYLGNTPADETLDVEQYIIDNFLQSPAHPDLAHDGTFKVRVLDGRGKYKSEFTVQCEVAPSPAGRGLPTPSSSVQTSALPAGGEDPRVALLQQQLQRQHEQILALQQNASHPASGGLGIKDVMDIVGMLKGFGGGEKSGLGVKDILEIAGLIKDLSGGEGGAGDYRSEIVKTIRELGPEAIAALGSRRRGDGGGGGSDVATRTAPNPDDMIKRGIAMLKVQALKGVSVDTWVELILLNAEQYRDLVSHFLETPFDKFIELDAELAREPYRTWFAELHKELKNELSPGNDTDGKSGNAGDLKANAAARAGSGGKSNGSGKHVGNSAAGR